MQKTKEELIELYKDFLDEVYDSVKMLGCEFMPSQILYDCDPIGFRCGFVDWLDFEGLEVV